MRSYKAWTDEEEQFVRDHVGRMSDLQIAAALDRSHSAVKGFRQRSGIKSPNDGQFKKGQKAWNKGLKQEEFMSQDGIEATKATRFKKGEQPANTKFDGAVSMRQKDHPSGPYLWVRLGAGKWKLLHQYRWEQLHGPVPDGHIIVFKDGNSLHPHPDNLECITRAQNARRNIDYDKAMATMRQKGNHPAKNLSDAWVASMVAGHDEEIKQYLLDERPDIIRLARANYKLKRKITKDGTNK